MQFSPNYSTFSVKFNSVSGLIVLIFSWLFQSLSDTVTSVFKLLLCNFWVKYYSTVSFSTEYKFGQVNPLTTSIHTEIDWETSAAHRQRIKHTSLINSNYTMIYTFEQNWPWKLLVAQPEILSNQTKATYEKINQMVFLTGMISTCFTSQKWTPCKIM